MQEKISVIVPVYNTEATIGKCLDSILNQTYQNLEVILVDDGSRDDSGTICDQYARQDQRVRVIHKKNAGQSAARNDGMAIASGDYIGFVDADDWIVPDMYEMLLEMIHQYDCPVTMCSFTRKESELQVDHEQGEVKIYAGQGVMDFFYRIHGEPSFYSVWNRLYRKDILENIRFLTGVITEDVYFTYEVYKRCGKIAVSPARKYFYYKNPTGTTRSKLCGKDAALIQIWDKIVKQEKGTKDEEYARLNRARAPFTLLSKGLIYGRTEDVSKDQLKQWRREVQKNYSALKNSGMITGYRKILLYWIAHGVIR